MARIFKTNGEVVEVHPKNGTDFQLDELQAIVGGYIEVVGIHNGYLIVCDEEGKLKGKERNHNATGIFQAALQANDFLVGDVLICKEEEIK